LERANEILFARRGPTLAGARPPTALVTGVHRGSQGPVPGRADLPSARQPDDRAAPVQAAQGVKQARPRAGPGPTVRARSRLALPGRTVHAGSTGYTACAVAAPRHQPPRHPAPGYLSWSKRNFAAKRPNQLGVVDFTYVPTWEGTVFGGRTQPLLNAEALQVAASGVHAVDHRVGVVFAVGLTPSGGCWRGSGPCCSAPLGPGPDRRHDVTAHSSQDVRSSRGFGVCRPPPGGRRSSEERGRDG
jgi:hypothetical protein